MAPVGTVTTIWVSEVLTKLALFPFNLTEAVAERFVPVIVTEEPTAPEEFDRPVILGASETVGTLTGCFAVGVVPGIEGAGVDATTFVT